MRKTRGMLDADAIGRMKPGAILIDAGRGGVIDALFIENLRRYLRGEELLSRVDPTLFY